MSRVARPWLGLAVLMLPTQLSSNDVSVMLLALPRISEDVGADSTQMLWIMDIYGLMLAGFISRWAPSAIASAAASCC